METTRTSSPYFSPNSAMRARLHARPRAPSAASRRASSAARRRWPWPPRPRSPRAPSAWSARSRSAAGRARPASPSARRASPSTWRSASCRRWVAEWLARVARAARVIDHQLDGIARLEGALLDAAEVHEQVAQLLLRVGDAEQRALGALDDALVADLAAGLAVERRLVQHQRGLLAGLEAADLLAVPAGRRGSRPRRSPCRSPGSRWRRRFSLTSNQTVSVAASPEPFQALRASSFCFCIAASKAASVDA